jgi:formate dehydrogenase iron-sulfur subunit
MKTILIDLIKYRETIGSGCDQLKPEGVIPGIPEKSGLKSIRELAVFAFTCRRCEDAPCIAVCPEDALRKNDDGLVERSTHRCVACKSCVVTCPFGTMMSDFYEYKRTEKLYHNLKDDAEREKFINESPEDAVTYTEQAVDEKSNIYELMPGILVRDYPWSELKNLE